MNQTPPPGPPPPPHPSIPVGTPPAPPRQGGRGCWFYGCIIALVLVLVIVLTAAGTAWWIRRSMSPPPIEPVVLSQTEEAALDEKLELLGGSRADGQASEPAGTRSGRLDFEVDQDFVRKPVLISEREINGLIARNPELAGKVSVSLTQDRIKVSANIPLPPDVPMVGGQTLRLKMLTKLVVADGRSMLMLEDLAVGGIPIPSAWLQDVKGRDLLADIQQDEGMQALLQGIEKLEIQDGQILFLPAK